MNYHSSISQRFWLCIIPILFIWFALFLGNRPFATPDEGRYVEIPREMVATNDFVTPRLNGVKYFEKPPLFYWIQAGNIKLFGLQEWTMRLTTIFFGMLGCIAIYLFGRRFYNEYIGMTACLILATSPLYYAVSRIIILDMPVTTLTTLSLFAFLMTIHTSPGLYRRLWAWGFYIMCALGVLTKGLMVLAISGPVILIWSLATGRWKDLWPAYLPSGFIIFLLIAAPWHILASINNPEFFYKYFVVEHFLRYTTSMHMRSQPIYFFIPVLLLGFFPWVIFLWKGIKDAIQKNQSLEQRGITIFLLIWAGWTFVFFSISNSKLVTYILPCFPPLALILGAYAGKLLHFNNAHEVRNISLTFGIFLIVFAILGLFILWALPNLLDHRPYLISDFTILMGVFLSISFAAIIFTLQQRQKNSLSLIPLCAIALNLAVVRLMPELQRPSIKPLAQIIQQHKHNGDIVASYKTYYQDLPVYMNEVVNVIDVKGELEFGCEVEDCSKWMYEENKFLQLWKGDRRYFVIAQRKEIAALTQRIPTFRYFTLGSSNGNVLITNKEFP